MIINWSRSALALATPLLALAMSACSPSLPLLAESAPLPPLPQPVPNSPPAPPTTTTTDEEPLVPQEARLDSDWLNRERLWMDLDLGKEDWRHYYGMPNVLGVPAGVAAAAPLANTSADQEIRDWYQQRIRGSGAQTLADLFDIGGQVWVAVPIGLEAAAVMGWIEGGSPTDGGLWEWSHRSLRAAAVGYPPVIALYFLLGGARPYEGDSNWRPFNDWHGVSGHTFIGAVPFLTAAAMTDDPFLKAPLLLGSLMTGWARINKDEHYFSQVALGWWLAYLAVQAVDQTQDAQKCLTVTPGFTPEGPGVTVRYQF